MEAGHDCLNFYSRSSLVTLLCGLTGNDQIWHGSSTSGTNVLMCHQPRVWSQGGRDQASHNLWDLQHECTQYEKQQPDVAWDQTRCEVCFSTVDHDCWRMICLR